MASDPNQAKDIPRATGRSIKAITPDDSVDLPKYGYFFAMSTGVVYVDTLEGDQNVPITIASAPWVLPVLLKRVRATGLTISTYALIY